MQDAHRIRVHFTQQNEDLVSLLSLGVQSIAIRVSVWLAVCLAPLAYLTNHMYKPHNIFCTC